MNPALLVHAQKQSDIAQGKGGEEEGSRRRWTDSHGQSPLSLLTVLRLRDSGAFSDTTISPVSLE